MLSSCWSLLVVVSRGWIGGWKCGGAGCNTNSPFPVGGLPVRLTGWSAMLLFHDPDKAASELTAGRLGCPHQGCEGVLRPWGYARLRRLRVAPGRGDSHRPRRARCRSCRRTQVLAWARSYPRRPDSVETVGSALLAAMAGLGYRKAAAQVGVPATTVRGWFRRARENSEAVRRAATIAVHALDPMAGPLKPTGTPLGDMLDAVGRAASAYICRLGPVQAPWQLATAITRGGILAPSTTPSRRHN